MRFLSGREVNLRHEFLDDEDGTVTPSSVSVTVFAEDGTQAFAASDLTPAESVYSANAGVLAQGLYRVVWTGSSPTVSDTEFVEVVGAFLFSLPEARNSDRELESQEDYPASELKHYREVIETEFETITKRSFTPRTKRVVVETDGSDCLWIGKLDCASLVAISGPDGALVASDYRLEENGLLNGLSGFPCGTLLTLTVDYGFRAVPEDIKRVALVRLRFLLAAENSGVPDRATSYVADSGGTFTLATPGKNGYKIGIPEVDATLNQYSYDVLASVLTVG